MEKHRKKLVYGVIGIVSVLLVILGSSYAFWKLTFESETNIVNSQCFKLNFVEQENSNISLLEGYPISDEDGKKLMPYTFQITNDCDAKARYTIRLELDNSSTMNEQYIKSMLNTGSVKRISDLKTTEPTLANAKSSYVLEEKVINGHSSEEYELRLWIDGGVTSDNKEVMNQRFQGKITIDGNYDDTYTESILNGTDPVLKEGLIPVTIDNDGSVHKADTTKEWYKYENKIWANAVILNDETKTYDNNEVIPEENIESYFVWIPRYRYQIWDNGMYYELSDSVENKAQEIKVVFENKETQLSKGTKKEDWLTHPAFTSFDVNGMWVGKFETGYKGSTDKSSAESNTIEPEKVQIKPNVNSWRSIQVANAFYTTYDYKRDLDSHMMKNTEWGAVAYLQHSKYGIARRARNNNNEVHITGYSALSEPTCGYTGTNEECNRYGTSEDITKPWNTAIGYLASTTGNISGIYDMSGGSWEYVMGVMTDKNGNPVSGTSGIDNSGFNGPFGCLTCENPNGSALLSGVSFPNLKYYDIYAYSSSDKFYNQRILGDATGEIGPFANINYLNEQRPISSWCEGESWFINFGNPWFLRGGAYYHGHSAVEMSFTSHYGNSWNVASFRVVLAI